MNPSSAILGVLVTCLGVLAPVAFPSRAVAVPLSQFLGMDVSEIRSVRVAFFYCGSSIRLMPSVGFACRDSTFSWESLEPPDTAGVRYVLLGSSFELDPEMLKRLVDSLATVPGLNEGVAWDRAEWHVILQGIDEGREATFGAMVDRDIMTAIMTKTFSIVSDVPSIRCSLAGDMARHWITPPGQPTQCSHGVKASFSEFTCDSATQTCFGSLEITNLSGAALPGPIVVVVGHARGMEVMNADGTTCVIMPGGMPYVVMQEGALGIGESVQRRLEVRSPDREEVLIGVQHVYSGPGLR